MADPREDQWAGQKELDWARKWAGPKALKSEYYLAGPLVPSWVELKAGSKAMKRAGQLAPLLGGSKAVPRGDWLVDAKVA